MMEWFGPLEDLRRIVLAVPGLRVVEYARPKWQAWSGRVLHGAYVGVCGRWMVTFQEAK